MFVTVLSLVLRQISVIGINYTLATSTNNEISSGDSDSGDSSMKMGGNNDNDNNDPNDDTRDSDSGGDDSYTINQILQLY